MRIDTKMFLSFGTVFFVCEAMDYFLPPKNIVFNATLGLLSALMMFARWAEQQSEIKTGVGQ